MRCTVLSLLLLLSLSLSGKNFSDTPLTTIQINHLATLAKTWGFLKYYHPAVAKGRYDWDSVLIKKIPAFIRAKKTSELNKIIAQWLDELGDIGNSVEHSYSLSDAVLYNLDTTWILNSGFDKKIIARLQTILKRKREGQHHYYEKGQSWQIKIRNEKPHNTAFFLYPSADWRLLILFRYWNIVNYFSPYKYLAGEAWDKVLTRFIPALYHAKDELKYQLTVQKMVNALGDGHAVLTWTALMNRHFGEYKFMPFRCFIVDNKAIVVKINNEVMCREQGIELYDIIDSIDGESVEKKFAARSQYLINASNEEAAIAIFCSNFLFAGKDNLCTIVKWTPGSSKKMEITRYKTPPDLTIPSGNNIWKILTGNIGYVNMEYLLKEDVNVVMDSLANTKGIIFDLRDYPHDTWPLIAARLSSKKFLMSRMIYPDLTYPGVFRYHAEYLYGQDNHQPYKGKVVILVNAFSKSHAENSAMGLQASSKTITIGSQTAGANGDLVEWINLTGGFRTRFSGLGIYYPDGTPIQPKGVKIDIVCKPTLAGALARKDELVEKAINVINGSF